MKLKIVLIIVLGAILTAFNKESLPKVLIIGDSISIGYTPYVKTALKDWATVVHNKGNAQHTGNGLEKLDEWLGDTKWDVIHFNWGLWDLAYRNPNAKTQGNRDKINGKVTYTPEQYGSNLETLVLRLKKTGAKLIFATTSYVPDGEVGRFVNSDAEYNAVALKIMRKYGVTVNPLHEISKTIHSTNAEAPNNVHYTEEGYKLLSKPVVELIKSELKQQPKAVAKKPNIIFILTDDLGYGDLGVFFQNQLSKDKPRAFTPNLDKMAAEGALLPQHYAAAPVCAPSRASFLSGRSQGHANVRDNQFDKALENNLTIGSALQQAGYATAAIGKWGLQGRTGKAPNWEAHPLNRGFDYYLGYIRHGDGHEHYPKEGIYRGKKEVYENRTNIAADLDKCYTADLWTAAAKKWIVNHKKGKDTEKPFFMYLSYDTPHAVLELPTQAYPEGDGLNGGLQWTGIPGQMINTASGVVDSWMHPDYAKATYDHDNNAKTPAIAWPDVYKRYATDTRRIDNAVGDLLQLLKDLEIDEETMVVFTSDNGPSRESYLKNEPYEATFFESFGSFDGIKRDCWEGGLRVPTIARWPTKIPEGHTIETPSISYDWMPTFIDMAGYPIPAITDGVSLLPSLLDKGKQKPSQIYVEYFQGGKTPAYSNFLPERQQQPRKQMQMIRDGNLVGVRYNIQSNNDDFEIYDVVKDPQQTRNLANTSKMAALQVALKSKAINARMLNNTALRPYDNALIPAVSLNRLENGVYWKGYQGNFPWVSELSGIPPLETGVLALPKVNVEEAKKFDGNYFEGYIKVPTDGEYTFYVTVNKAALLRIHNATVVDADQGYFSNSPKSGRIKLKAGLHPFRLYTIHGKKGKPTIDFEWSGPGFTRKTIDASSFFYTKN